MAIVGVICEYDPFHKGHAHQFSLIRALLPGARIVCLMSGCFTQRGMPALHAPAFRAESALNAGADMVLELPCMAAVRDAEHFALGGVEILTRLGFVTHLSFGVESSPDALARAAELLEAPTPLFSQALRNGLDEGLSPAAAQGRALSLCLPEAGAPWDQPNNILALCYLRAIRRLQSPLLPLPVLREGDYHADSLTPGAWPSASAVRKAFLQGRFSEADAACPSPLPRSPVCPPDALDRLLLHKLRTSSAESLRLLPDCTEGLEHRLKSCAAQASGREELLALLKTKRYAYARLSRLCAHALLDMPPYAPPAHVRLLGFRRSSRDLLSLFRSGAIPLLSKAACASPDDAQHALDRRAYELWALGAGLPSGLLYTQKIVIV